MHHIIMEIPSPVTCSIVALVQGYLKVYYIICYLKIMTSSLHHQIEEEIMLRVLKETQERVRLFEENQRRWQQELNSPSISRQVLH